MVELKQHEGVEVFFIFLFFCFYFNLDGGFCLCLCFVFSFLFDENIYYFNLNRIGRIVILLTLILRWVVVILLCFIQ